MEKGERMTAEELKDFRKLAYTIRYWEEQLKDEKKKSYLKSPQLTGLPSAGGLKDPTADRALAEEKITSKIERLVQQQKQEAERVMDWIQGIEDPMIQAIMHARYIKGKSWTAVAYSVGGNNTPDSVRMLHNRYLFVLFGTGKIK